MKLLLVSILSLLAFLSSICLAQQPLQRARIEGVVVRTGTSEPISGARVILSRVNVATGVNVPEAGGVISSSMSSAGNTPPPPRPAPIQLPGGGASVPPSPAPAPALPVVTTDRDGRFVMPDLEPGTYRILVLNVGYVRQEYGQRVFPGQGTPLTLNTGQTVNDIKVALTPTGNLSGRIVDEFGQPAIGMPLQLLKAIYNQYGLSTFQSSGTATTNDRGEYRIYLATPGRYYLLGGTEPGPTMARAADSPRFGPSPNDPGENYAFVYYPGSTNLNQATTITIRPGDEIIADFSVPKQRLYQIRGRIVDGAAGRPPSAVNISLSYQTVTGAGGTSAVGPLYDSSTGNFEIRNMLPGTYLLQFSSATASSRTMVELVNKDLDGLAITLRNGLNLPGVVRMEGGAIPPGFRIQLRPVVSGAISLLGFAPANPAPAADGTFKLARVLAGQYRVSLPSSPDYYVQSVRFDQTDALNQPLVVPETDSSSAVLEIVLSPKVGRVDGVVTDARLQPAPGVQAVLVPDKNRDRADLYKAVTSDQIGHFTMRGIAPGDYKVFAWETLESFGYFDPDLLKQSEPSAKAVHIEESSVVSVEVKSIPAAQ